MTDHPGKARSAQVDDVVELLEEEVVVGLRAAVTGRVRVTTHVERFEQIAHADLAGDVVDVVRVPIDRPIAGALPEVRTEGDVTIVPIFEEVLVVEKRLVLKEELHIRRHRTAESIDIPVMLRRQTATVERVDGVPLPLAREDKV